MSWEFALLNPLYQNPVVPTFEETLLATQPTNLLAVWPLNDTSGSVATDISGNSRHGAYSGVTLANSTFQNGNPVPLFPGSANYINIYSASLNAVFTPAKMTALVFGKVVNVGAWTDATARVLLNISGNSSNYIRLYKSTTSNLFEFRRKAAGAAEQFRQLAVSSPHWFMLAVTVDESADEMKFFYNATQVGTTVTSLDIWNAANLGATVNAIGQANQVGTFPWSGWAAYGALWKSILSPAEISSIYSSLFTIRGYFPIGDSKTETAAYVRLLSYSLETETGQRWQEQPNRYAISGWTSFLASQYVAANLAAETKTAHKCTINLGANDVVTLPAEATWKGYYTSIINNVRSKWPGISIYLAKPWRRTYDTECNTIAGWIDDVVALYPSGVSVGMDERIWLENGDNGVTYTTDGIHYNAAAEPVAAAAWLAGMGY